VKLPAKILLSVLLCFGTALIGGRHSPALAGSLDLSKPLSLSCETTAVKLDANPFQASKGTIVLALALDDSANPKGSGRWKLSSNTPEHAASFAAATPKSCNPDCPFTRGKDGSIQLWSPKPLALSQLDETTSLVLISINPATMELKASSFRNKELAGLERGECSVVGGDGGDQPAPAKPAESPAKGTKETTKGPEETK
jgi:hypothetical protein